jgi:hypothetical protein
MAYDAQDQWKPEDDSVKKQITGMMSSDSPYMKAARNKGHQFANQRGMMNSSIAGQAAEAAAINAALPIAQQDASQIAAKNSADLGFKHQQSLNTQTQGHQMEQIDKEDSIRKDLLKIRETGLKDRFVIEQDTKLQMTDMENAQKKQDSITESLRNMGQQLSQDEQKILVTEHMSEDDRAAALTEVRDIHRQTVDLITSANGIQLDWD